VYCAATVAHVSVTPELPTVEYARRKFLVVDATADALPDPLVSDGDIRVSVPAPQDPYSPTADGAAIIFYWLRNGTYISRAKMLPPILHRSRWVLGD